MHRSRFDFGPRGVLATRARSLFCAALATLIALGATGCGGDTEYGNVIARPDFLGGEGLRLELAADEAVALRVTDARQAVGPEASGGRETISSGDKAKVIMARSVRDVVLDAYTDALVAAGARIDPNAPVVLDVKLHGLYLRAYQFTHWGLPSERASSLDLLPLPGPVRDTTATIDLFVTVRKHDQEIGFSSVVRRSAQEVSKRPEIVSGVLSTCLTDAVNTSLADAGRGIELATALPVTAEEFDDQSARIAALQHENSTLLGELSARRDELSEQTRELDVLKQDVRRQRAELGVARAALVDADGARADVTQQVDRLGSERAALERDRAALAVAQQALTDAREMDEQRRRSEQAQLDDRAGRLTRRGEELAMRERTLETRRTETDQDRDAARAELAGVMTRLSARQADLDRETIDLLVREESLDATEAHLAAQETNLGDQIREIAERTDRARTEERRLAVLESELDRRAVALTQWEGQLREQRVDAPPRDLVINRSPSIVLDEPTLSVTTRPRIPVRGLVVDDDKVERVRCTVNGIEVATSPESVVVEEESGGFRFVPARRRVGDTPRGLTSTPTTRISFLADLTPGTNVIKVEAWDGRGAQAVEEVTVEFRESSGNAHLLAIGINQYADQGVPDLRYACNDARVVASTFVRGLGIDDANVGVLLDEEANLRDIRLAIDELRKNARKDDTVILYFSGHGAPESEANSPDGDGLEKYLLPHDAAVDSFFGSALPMQDLSRFLARIPSERIVFIADTCYSGAASGTGARTLALGHRSFEFRQSRMLARLAGTGRIIMTASRGSEISQERESLEHGVFTWHLVRGLEGAADVNQDRRITVDELYAFVSEAVPADTSNQQHPMMSKDKEAAGEIVLGRID